MRGMHNKLSMGTERLYTLKLARGHYARSTGAEKRCFRPTDDYNPIIIPA